MLMADGFYPDHSANTRFDYIEEADKTHCANENDCDWIEARPK